MLAHPSSSTFSSVLSPVGAPSPYSASSYLKLVSPPQVMNFSSVFNDSFSSSNPCVAFLKTQSPALFLFPRSQNRPKSALPFDLLINSATAWGHLRRFTTEATCRRNSRTSPSSLSLKQFPLPTRLSPKSVSDPPPSRELRPRVLYTTLSN